MRPEKIRIVSDSDRMTRDIARGLFAHFKKNAPRIVLLKGDIGAGKTTFVQGALEFFGVRTHAASPTFVLMKHYKVAQNPKQKTQNAIKDMYHVDAYRLRSKKDLDMLELPFENENALFFIEWPEQVRVRPKNALTIHFKHGSHEGERVVEIGG